MKRILLFLVVLCLPSLSWAVATPTGTAVPSFFSTIRYCQPWELVPSGQPFAGFICRSCEAWTSLPVLNQACAAAHEIAYDSCMYDCAHAGNPDAGCQMICHYWHRRTCTTGWRAWSVVGSPGMECHNEPNSTPLGTGDGWFTTPWKL